jgi:hypothetical protein
MCFSTEASFTAALVLAITGSLTLKNNSLRPQFFLAAIPLLFALQQLSEGFVWLHISKNIGSDALFYNAQRAFLTFAFLVWPIWIPLSLAMVEAVPWRRFVLILILYAGVILSLLNLSYAMKHDISVQVVNHSLHYSVKVPPQAAIYPLIVLLPCFISNLKKLKLFGILIVIGYLIAAYFYKMTFVSVWCFFAAIVSLLVYKILKENVA